MTAAVAWATLLAIFATCLEVWCGRLGLVVAAWPLLTLYLGVALRPRWGAWTGLATCVLCEVALARTWTSLPLICLIVPLTIFWRRHGDRRYLIIQMLPAGFAGLVYATFALAFENWHGPHPVLDPRQSLLLIAAGTAASALGGPLLWRLLDPVATITGLPRFYQPRSLPEFVGEEGPA